MFHKRGLFLVLKNNPVYFDFTGRFLGKDYQEILNS